MTEYLLDSLKDSVRLLPFLFLTYLLMETLEHKAGSGARRRIQTAGKFGPLWGEYLELFRSADSRLQHPACLQEE